ncbi:MAG: peptidoglycan DD-metalloendopeptidase family protein [Candidatus Thermoplasmatota archaeon]|nr:peptidoglycan DD-metalloendopeptidase family protein [Candidatus Thermoplasmatota archaeon]
MEEDTSLNLSGYNFHFIVDLPKQYYIHDFTKGNDKSPLKYSVGRYDENRKGLYESELFSGIRTLHVGIDIGGPVNTPVHAFHRGVIFNQTYLPSDGDYGNVIIMEHEFNGTKLWALYGHLSSESIKHLEIGQVVESGQIIGWFGDKSENGGWEPHVHFQLSLERPESCDMPGVVNPEDRESALMKYPDPRLVLGQIY